MCFAFPFLLSCLGSCGGTEDSKHNQEAVAMSNQKCKHALSLLPLISSLFSCLGRIWIWDFPFSEFGTFLASLFHLADKNAKNLQQEKAACTLHLNPPTAHPSKLVCCRKWNAVTWKSAMLLFAFHIIGAWCELCFSMKMWEPWYCILNVYLMGWWRINKQFH